MSKTIEVVIEIPKGSRNKYEYDHKKDRIVFDRMLFSPMHYPADYGYIPDTLGGDGDPLDVLVLFTEPTFPGCYAEVRPVGVFLMSDDKGEDEKIICIPVGDPIANQIESLDQVNPHLLREIEHFFKVYKDLENKTVTSNGYAGAEKAHALIEEAIERFKKH
ncbi:MAG: inorganic pyrophosphatase [Flavobacteriaceae bacterium]|nr:MAG: inorganic pyrophosphatase [Flavobacteriaceae bacterium]